MRKLITFKDLKPQKGIGDSRMTLSRKMKDKKFPQCVRTSDRRIAWFEDEIDIHNESLKRGKADHGKAKKQGE